jgi:lysophospholipid acyltransferase (LPLAT)-like uncharacterized protein
VKDLLKREPVQRAIAWLIASYIRFVFNLTRWTYIGDAEVLARAAAGKPFIVCFWHGRMILMPKFWRFTMPMYLLGSPHRDGQLILRTMRHFGVQSIIGSSSKHGARALREMARVLADNGAVCIAPDGPRGPRMRVSPGIIALARLSGAPIVPITFSVANGRILRSWDRFLFALPFGRGTFIAGEHLWVPADADDQSFEAARAELERRLNAITSEADHQCHREPVTPAPPEAPASDTRAA